MCYSFKTSILSYSLGIISGIFAIKTGQYILGFLILFYCQMQLSEALIWRGIDTNNISLNKIGTIIGKYSLPTHNIGIALGYLVFVYLTYRKFELKYFIPLAIAVGFYLVIIFKVYKGSNSDDVTYPLDRSCIERQCQNNRNRLKWPFPTSWYLYSYILSVILFIILIDSLYVKIFLFLIFTISIVMIYKIFPNGAVSSVWCFSAAVLSPVIVIVCYFLEKIGK